LVWSLSGTSAGKRWLSVLCELAEHEGVEPVGLPAGGAEPVAGGIDLVGVDGQHRQPGVQQPVDQQPVRALDRDALHAERAHGAAQLA
jgi:hypothetical protein